MTTTLRIAPVLAIVGADEATMSPEHQPVPYEFTVIPTPDGAWSAVVRHWRPEDIPRCRLCPVGRCEASLVTNSCSLMFRGRVQADDAARIDASGLRWPGR